MKPFLVVLIAIAIIVLLYSMLYSTLMDSKVEEMYYKHPALKTSIGPEHTMDGMVTLIRDHMDQRVTDPGWDPDADIDMDGEVTSTDLSYALGEVPFVGYEIDNNTIDERSSFTVVKVWNRSVGDMPYWIIPDNDNLSVTPFSGSSRGEKDMILLEVDRSKTYPPVMHIPVTITTKAP